MRRLGAWFEMLKAFPELVKLLPIFSRALSNPRIRELWSNTSEHILFPSLKGLNLLLSSEVLEAWENVLNDSRVQEGLNYFFSSIDPDAVEQLSSILGAVMAALTVELLKDEKSREAIAGLISNLGFLVKHFVGLLQSSGEQK